MGAEAPIMVFAYARDAPHYVSHLIWPDQILNEGYTAQAKMVAGMGFEPTDPIKGHQLMRLVS